MTDQERFGALCQRQPDGCLLWTGARTRKYARTRGDGGYPVFHVKDALSGAWRSVLAHRWVLTQATGISPVGYDAGHLCGTRRCVEPTHLEWQRKEDNRSRCEWRPSVRMEAI